MKNRVAFPLLAVAICLCSTEALATVGRTVGQFNVSSAGSAQYSIPIWAPPGPRGIQPNIALFYDSGSSIGPIGIGWSIAGLGAITRCNLTYAQDTTPAAVALAISDGYCLNGNRLRLTSASGTYGDAGSTYQTEIADFSNITAYSYSGVTGIGYFIVQGRNGLTYYYGYTDPNGNGANSRVLATGTTTADYWLLSKVVDRAGNNYVINYTLLTGAAVPNDILWTPASAGSSTYGYKMLFNYTSNLPQSSVTKYVAGTSVTNTKLLSSIEIYSSSTVVKDYFLAYEASATTGRDELKSVTECADSGESNCLSPTTVTYQSGADLAGISSPETATGSGATNGTVYSVDINGDGLQDLVFATNSGSNYQWWVQFASASGYGAPVNTGALTSGTTDFLVDNFAGSQAAQILAPVGGVWYSYTWNGTSFTAASTGIAVVSGASYSSADVDGDGLPDLVSVTASTTAGAVNVGVQRNTGHGVGISFATTPTVNTVAFSSLAGIPLSIGNVWGNYQFPNSSVKHLDFDGDGRQDILLEATFQGGYYIVPLLSRGILAPVVGAGLASSAHPTAILPVNWNDDACTDIVLSTTLLISPCNGTAQTQVTLPSSPGLALDWDGDGRTDLLANINSVWELYRSEGTTFAQGVSTGIAIGVGFFAVGDANGDGLDDLMFANCSSNCAIYYGLHNGVGIKPDLATSFEDGFGNSASPTYVPISQSNYEDSDTVAYPDAVYPYQNYIGPLYVVSESVFSDPSSSTGGTYNQKFYYYGAWTNLQGRGFQAFASKRTLDSRYVSPNLLYHYEYYERSFPYTGMKYQDIESTGVFYTSESTGTPAVENLSTTANEQRYFPYFSNWNISQWEWGGSENADPITTASLAYQYDSYGNIISEVKTVTDVDPGSPYKTDSWTTTINNTIDIDQSANVSADLAAWCLNMLDETEITYGSTINGSSAITRTTQFIPDVPANCRINQIITEPNNPLYKVTETLTYDNSGGATAFGNVVTDTVTGVNMPSSPASRVTTLNWGTTGQFLNSLTDPSGAKNTWTYTTSSALTFGVPDTRADANSLITKYSYDPFGRKTSEIRPDGTSTTWTWSACTSNCNWSNSVYQVARALLPTTGSAIRTDTTSYDPIDRATQTTGPTITAGGMATTQQLYNSLGLLAQQSMPFLSGTAYQQTFAYDVLNRLVEVERPVNVGSGQTYCNPTTLPPVAGCQGVSYAYAGRTTVLTDAKGYTKTTVTDVDGKLRKTTDAIGYTVTKVYDAAESLTGVTDSVGNTLLSLTIAYGIKPFVTAANDADRGAWNYTVDSLGERTGWTDAKSPAQAFYMSFDALSRPVNRSEPDTYTQWQYGSTPASYNVGQLILECTQTGTNPTSCGTSPQYSESRAYDSYGRLATRSISEYGNPGNNAGGVFLYTLGYSATTGFLNSLTYPISTSSVALNLQYGYTNGLLSSVTDTTDSTSTCGSTCTLWTATGMNARAQITQEKLGNGVVTNRSYDAVTSWLTVATAGVGGGSSLLNQSYSQDMNGNVSQRAAWVNTESLIETFYYDHDNRLCAIALGGTGSCTSPTIVYDGGVAGPGNITNQSGVGSYNYPSPGQPRPHAVTSITGTFNGVTNPSFSYDANGNMTDRASSSTNIFWTSFNYPAEISTSDVTGSEEVLFSYGPDRQRVEQIYTVPGSTTEQTYYVGNGGMPAPAQLEVVFNGTTNYRHYIYAGSEPVALYTRTSTGGITMSYMLEDHQGGVSAITSNAGATDVDQSFSAFGQLRNSLTWSGAPTTTQLNSLLNITRQGYTFQTGLGQSMGLNHMNGRVQDAILGRFLSPDPHVPDRTNAQSYNRYTYANNNPVTLVDPSGFAAVCETWGFCSGDIGNLYSGLGGAESGSVAGLSGGDMSLTDSSNSSLALMVAFPSSWNWTGDEWAEANAVLNAALNPSTSNSGTTSSPNASVPDGTGLAGPPAQSQSSGGTVWGDGCGGTCDITAGVTVTTSGTGSVGSTPQNWVDPSLTQNFNQTPLGQFSLLNPRFYLEALVTKPLSWLTIRGLTRLGVPSTVVNTIFGVGGAAAIPLYEAGTAAGAEDLFFQQATQTLPQNLPGPYGSGVDMGGGVYWQEDFPQ